MYLRARGETARFVRVESLVSEEEEHSSLGPTPWPPRAPQDSSPPPFVETLSRGSLPKGLEALGHGDLFRLGDSDYRATDIYVVDRSVDPPGVSRIADDSHGRIPASVASKIQDPAAFYAGVRDACDIAWIDLTAGTHQALVQTASGGREVSPVRKVRYAYGERQHDTYSWSHRTIEDALMIEGPMSEDIQNARPLWVVLDARTPAAYLSAAIWLESDPIMEQCRAANRKAHVDLASAFFFALLARSPSERGALSLCSLPLDRVTSSWAASTGRLTSVAQSSADPHRVESVTVWSSDRGPSVYRPRALSRKGPFGGVPVWCEEEPGARWMIDLTDLVELPDYQ
jgi:hypothetical protein